MKEKSIEEMNLTEKLAKIRNICEVVKKKLKGFNYTYSDLNEILESVTGGMKKYHVSLMPRISAQRSSIETVTTTNTKTDKTGARYDQTNTEMLYTGDMVYSWVNNDNPAEIIDIPWFATGSMPDPAQALGTALSYSLRQFLIMFFQIAQVTEDVDSYRTRQKEAEQFEDKLVASEIIKTLDDLVKNLLEDHPEKKEELKEFIISHTNGKSANYFKIKTSEEAGKLLESFKSTYIKE